MRPYITSWAWRCPDCRLQAALHSGSRNPTGWDPDSAEALAGLREDNARRLLQALETCTPLKGKRLLDVGCAGGWFLKAANERGLKTVGMEPDGPMAERARQGGFEIRNGCFPQALGPEEQFDIVSFNDVFEHLQEPRSALKALAECLPAGALLVLNLPCASGFLYRLASALAQIGFTGPFERLWQCHFESPHLYYFDRANLRALVEPHGFRLVGSTRVETLAVRGLWTRINESGTLNPVIAGLTWLALVALYPAARYLLPNDIMVQFYERH